MTHRSVPGTLASTGSFVTGLLILTSICAFAANSILCRLALAEGKIDAFTFTSVRLLSGAVVLTLVLFAKSRRPLIALDPFATCALIVYALAFSVSYLGLHAGAGALLLFGAVQITMLSVSIYRGERLSKQAWLGFALAITGLLAYLLPGSTGRVRVGHVFVAWSTRAEPCGGYCGKFPRSRPDYGCARFQFG